MNESLSIIIFLIIFGGVLFFTVATHIVADHIENWYKGKLE